jgi:hypothetical protein
MIQFIVEQLLFYSAILIVLFLPGYSLLLALFGKRKLFSSLERLVVFLGLSLVLSDFLMLLLSRFGILLTRLSLLSALTIFVFFNLGIYFFRLRKKPTEKVHSPSFSQNQTVLIVAILFLTIFFKTAYLRSNVVPSSTDLGHHMYWSKLIAENGVLPEYSKRDIEEIDGKYSISQPKPISDFIIGEHLVFSAISLISGISLASSLPILILALINIFSVLAIFILALRFFEDHPQGKNIAIISLLLVGPLFALSPPQAKYVSGGVIGNILGNFLIPLTFYFLFRGIKEKRSTFFALGLLVSLGLVYTHHLSAFIFIFSLVFSLVFLIVIRGKNFPGEAKKWLSLFITPAVLGTIIFGVLFFFFINTPEYIKNNAVETVIGEPSRITKEGLTLQQLKETVGESRAALGIVGLILLLAFSKKNPYASAIISGWFLSIFLMSWKPAWLNIDIPSIRIANYLIFPLMLSGAFAWSAFFQDYFYDAKREKSYLAPAFHTAAFVLLFAFVFFTGFFDNAQSLKADPTSNRSTKTFAVAEYLARTTNSRDIILKDHNYVSADSWMKVFLMRDYNLPFTRGFYFRYEAPYKREMCTLWMISVPNSPEGERCFQETKTNFVVVNPQFDRAQFEKSDRFWPVYTNQELTVYYRQK